MIGWFTLMMHVAGSEMLLYSSLILQVKRKQSKPKCFITKSMLLFLWPIINLRDGLLLQQLQKWNDCSCFNWHIDGERRVSTRGLPIMGVLSLSCVFSPCVNCSEYFSTADGNICRFRLLCWETLDFLAPKQFKIIWGSNLLTIRVPDVCYSRIPF